jgi:hypothetical protein
LIKLTERICGHTDQRRVGNKLVISFQKPGETSP